MTTWLVRLDAPGAPAEPGPRVAVKDCIDVAGLPTTVGCPVIAERAVAATDDAPVVASARRAGAVIVGKTNLTELCWSADGINEWSGTPVNPLDATRVPGGSSSGSAVAVATGQADVGYGTDTGGSVRVPAACCGIVGLKTTWGRVPTGGVYPLAPSLDTVGPLGRDVAAVELGMRLMEPGFVAPAYDGPMRVGRLRPVDPAIAIRPEIDAAVDAVLAAAGFAAEDVPGADFGAALDALAVLIDHEGYLSNAHLLPDADRLCARNQRNMQIGAQIVPGEVTSARREQAALRELLDGALHRFPVLALPTLATPPPLLDERRTWLTALTGPINLAGLPALVLPVAAKGDGLPASLQLVGPSGGEETLIGVGRIMAAAAG
ncbi:MAG TPA: amidase [Streptosporangiaceae bacterium]|nr:amidase [Streptosporangiaceae bacterium]